jgi:hypothetical protein
MTRSFTAVLAAAAIMALASAAPALGATPVVIGQAPFGGTPDIAVDETGRGHFAWEDNSPSPEVVRYCQLPRGGAACENAEEFGGSPSSITGRAHVFLSGATGVNVFYQRCCGGTEGTYLVPSANGGIDFMAQNHVGDPGIGVNADEAVYGPGNSVTLLAEVITAGTTVQNTDFAGMPVTSQAGLGTSSSGEGAIGLEADGSPVAVYQLQTSPNWTFVWRKLEDGVPPTEANINLATNWTDPEAIITGERVNAADGPALASGPNGLFLFWKQNLPDQGWVQKWTGSGWTTPVQITDGRPFNDIDLHQDATGRLHAVWNAYTDQELRYTWSDDGVNWAAPVDIARGESYPQVRVAAAGDHQGFAVWNRGGPDVVAVALEALPEPPAGGGGGGGADTTDPAVSGFSIGDRTLRPGAGTTFSFTSSEAGRATLSFHKRVKGLKVRQRGRRRCVPQTRARLRRLRRSAGSRAAYRRLLRQRRCKAWKRVGVIRREVLAGRNEIVWNGRVAGRRLSPGLYQARLVIRDAAGNVSRAERLRFRVRRRR